MKKVLQLIRIPALLYLFLISILSWGQVTELFNFAGTSGYLATPASGWGSNGTEGGTYLKLSPGSVTSPEYTPYNNIVFKYDIASFGSGASSTNTKLIIVSSTNLVISEFTLNSANSSTYITNQTINVGNISTTFKIKIEGLGNGLTTGINTRGTRLRNYSLVGEAAPAGVPVVTPATVNGNVGTSLNYQIIATNLPTSYAIATGMLPAGLSLNTTSGIISGTPTTAGDSSLTVNTTNGMGSSTPATLDFVIAKGTQTITFAALADKQYGDANFNLTATSSSGTTIAYESSNNLAATVTGNTVTVVGVGTTNISASQAGNANYNAATNVVRSLNVTQRNLTLSGLTGDNKIYNTSTAATVSGTAVLNNILPADVSNVSLTGTPNYTFVTSTVGVSKPITANGFALSGSASANYSLTQPTGLAATIYTKPTATTGVAAQNKEYNGTTVAVITGGTLTGVEASDTANVAIATTGVFASANVGIGIAVTVSLTGSAALNYTLAQPGITANITKVNQIITFNALPTLNTSSSPVNLNTFASAASGLALTYESSNPDVVSVSGNTLTVIGVGTAIITASQAGDTNYNAAVNTTQGVTVALVPITIAQFNFTPSTLPTAAQVTLKNTNASVTDFAISSGTLSVGQTTGINFPNQPFVAGSAGWNATSQATAKNFNFNVTADQGYAIEVTSFEFNAFATSAGPSAISFNIASGLSNFTANAPDANLLSVNQTVSGVTNLTSIPVLMQGWANGSRTSTGGGIFRIDDVILKGYVTCIEPVAFEVTGGGAICGAQTVDINLSNSEAGMKYQLKIDSANAGAPVAGTGSALVFANQNTLGTYTIVATNSFCSASTAMTGSVVITAGICVTTWTITSPALVAAWTNGVPTAFIDAIIADDYNETEAIIANNLTIDTAKVLIIQVPNTLSVAGNLINSGSIIFKSDATGTSSFGPYTGAAISGTGKTMVERHIPASRAWRLLTAPLTGTTSNTISDNWQGTDSAGLLLFSPAVFQSQTMTGYVTGGTSPNIRKYNGGFQFINNLTTEPMFGALATDTKPFLVFATGASNSTAIITGAAATTLRPSGQLITGTVNHTGLAVDTYHLLANPYASTINTLSLLANNANQKLWLIDPTLSTVGAYATFDGTDWTPTIPLGADALIQSGQGFFVRSATATNFEIKESDKASGSSDNWFVRSANTATNIDKIRVLLYKQLAGNWKLADGALTVNYTDGSNEVNAMDSNKVSNFNESIMFRNHSTNLSIEHRALPLATEMQPLRITGTTALPYQLRLRTENYTNSLLLPILEDTATGTFIQIPSDGTEITIPFTGVVSTKTNPDNRFRIVYQTNLNNAQASTLVVSVFPNPITNNQLNVNLGTNTTSTDYKITNLLGQFIQKGQLVNTQNVITLSSGSRGFYILNITQRGKSFTTKIYIP
jgi:hypothetical protein